MKISTKLNLAFGVLLFLPLITALGVSYRLYARKLEKEARAKLQANRRTAELLIEKRLEEMQKLAAAYAGDLVLRFLVMEPDYFDQKLKHHLLYIAQEEAIDRAIIVWEQRQHIRAQNTIEDGEAALMALAPIYDRRGWHSGTLQIHQSLVNSGLLDTISRQTGLSVTLSKTALEEEPGHAVLPLLSSQGYPLFFLSLRRDPHPLPNGRRDALLIFLALGLGGILLIALLQAMVYRSIILPLRRLQEASERIQSGHFDLSLQAGHDEIGVLARAFIRMSASLQEHFDQCREFIAHSVTGMAVVLDGRIVFFNDAFSALLALKKQEGLNALVERIFPQGPQPELQLHGRWLACRESEILWHHQPATLLTVQDISAQKARELAQEQERRRLQAENRRLREQMQQRKHFGPIIGQSPPMQAIYDLLPGTAESEATVLITGETGTGKGLLAKTIHDLGLRKQKPFIPVNCGAVPEQLFENEFFGHVKGAFTGADKTTVGFLKHAEGGTLFLDEVGELPISMQVKLLHLLDGDGYAPIGSNLKHYPDIRIITATNQDVEQLIKERKLREDFYYRINVLPLTLEPLRKRKDDIPLLVDHFWERFELDAPRHGIHEQFCAYAWPGNIRELKNTIKRIAAGHDGIKPYSRAGQIQISSLQENLERHERFLIETALLQSGGHRETAARLLGVSERHLYRKIKKFDLD